MKAAPVSLVLASTLLLCSASAQALPCTLSTVTIGVEHNGVADREIVLDVSQGTAAFDDTRAVPFTTQAVVRRDAQGGWVGDERTNSAVAIGYQIVAACSGDRVQVDFGHVAQSGTQTISMAQVDEPARPPLTERFATQATLFGRPGSDSATFESNGWSYTLRAR